MVFNECRTKAFQPTAHKDAPRLKASVRRSSGMRTTTKFWFTVAGILTYIGLACVVIDSDLGARCYQGPFRPGWMTYVVMFPVAFLAWVNWLAGAPKVGISCDELSSAMIQFVAILGPMNGIIWTWVIKRGLVAASKGGHGKSPNSAVPADAAKGPPRG
jgi:hypothetical protein